MQHTLIEGGLLCDVKMDPEMSGPHRTARPARRRAGGGGGTVHATSFSEAGVEEKAEEKDAATSVAAAPAVDSETSNGTVPAAVCTTTPAAAKLGGQILLAGERAAILLKAQPPVVDLPPSELSKFGIKFSQFVGTLWLWALACAASATLTNIEGEAGPEAAAAAGHGQYMLQPVHVILPCVLLTAVASLDGVKGWVDRWVKKERLFDVVFKMYSAEPIALALLGLSVHLQSVVGMLVAVLVMFQGTQIFRIHRRTTGTVATGAVARLLLTCGAMGTCRCMPIPSISIEFV
jgi:hypothetical protein